MNAAQQSLIDQFARALNRASAHAQGATVRPWERLSENDRCVFKARAEYLIRNGWGIVP